MCRSISVLSTIALLMSLGYSRKDKLLKHMREKHTLLNYGFNHCFAEVLEAETESHLQQFHGNLECAIGACENTHKSCFLAANLFRHLSTSHSLRLIPYFTILKIRRTRRLGVSFVGRGKHANHALFNKKPKA